MEITTLEDGLEHVRRSPADDGTLEMIVRRPAEDLREVLAEALLSTDEGLVGDRWLGECDRDADGVPDPADQITMMNARAIALVAGDRDRWPLAGDQLYADLDLSARNLPPGTHLAIGSAVLEVSAKPHLGCGKFADRFGREARSLVNSEAGRDLKLRGINCRVVQPGVVSAGDRITKIATRP